MSSSSVEKVNRSLTQFAILCFIRANSFDINHRKEFSFQVIDFWKFSRIKEIRIKKGKKIKIKMFFRSRQMCIFMPRLDF